MLIQEIQKKLWFSQFAKGIFSELRCYNYCIVGLRNMNVEDFVFVGYKFYVHCIIYPVILFHPTIPKIILA